MSIQLYEEVEHEVNTEIVVSTHDRRYKVMIISQNSTDIFLVSKLLNELGSFKIYEAGNLSTALKVVGYHSLDLMIIDDTLPTLSGYDIIKRLNKKQTLKDVPKVMLLTQDYKESSYDNNSLDNLEFVKKPIDCMIFKTRVHLILKRQLDQFMGGSVFENMIDKKISEAKEFLKIYKSFLDMDENILFVYDRDKNRVLETNRNFSKFFGEISLFNRVLSSEKLMRYFVPNSASTNYLNSHHFNTWLDFIMSVKDFNFLLTLKRGSDKFSFNTTANKIKLFNKDIYIIKLSNHNIYNSRSSHQVKKQNKSIKPHLKELKNLFDNMDSFEDKRKVKKSLISVLDELELDSDIFNETINKNNRAVNVYFIIASVLKQNLDFISATLNSKVVDIDFLQDQETIYADVSADSIHDLVKGIIDCYHECENLQVDIKLFKIDTELKIEIVTVDTNDIVNRSLIQKVFNFNDESNCSTDQLQPKNIQNTLLELNADIKTYFKSKQNIFLISIPIN